MDSVQQPQRKKNLSAKERKQLRKQQRRNRQGAVLATSLVLAASVDANAASSDSQPGTFFTPATVQIVPEQNPEIRYVDEVVGERRAVPSRSACRTYSDRERAQMRLATLERVMLNDLKDALLTPGDTLTGRLAMLAYSADTQKMLREFVLGETYMRSLSERLLREPHQDPDAEDATRPEGSEPFALYEPSEEGVGLDLTPEGIEAWDAMRARLSRSKSALGTLLASKVGAPWDMKKRLVVQDVPKIGTVLVALPPSLLRQ